MLDFGWQGALSLTELMEDSVLICVSVELDAISGSLYVFCRHEICNMVVFMSICSIMVLFTRITFNIMVVGAPFRIWTTVRLFRIRIVLTQG